MKEQRTAATGGRHYLTLALSIVVCFAATALIIVKAMRGTGGIFIYPVDDAYIHMQIAKNIAFHGNWGISAAEFGSASSSPLYTVLLALLFRIFSDQVLIPLFVNGVAGLLLLFVVWRWLNREGLGTAAQILILLLVVFLTPLPLIMLSGMEHTLQCLFSFLFLFHFASWLQASREQGGEESLPPWPVWLYAVLAATVRYEGLFLVGMACLALFYYRKIGAGIKLGLVAVFPLVVFGIYSVAKGSYFLPNSVLVKSEAAQFSLGGMLHAFANILSERLTFAKSGVALLAAQRLLLILPASFLLFTRPVRGNIAFRFLLLALTGVTLLQLALADTGKFYRYEAYLIVCTTAALGVMIYRYWRERSAGPFRGNFWLALFIAFFLLLPLAFRSIAANAKISRAPVNIYDQQYQMALFIRQFYNNGVVAANDIGAISYFTDARIVDLWGLGDIDIARSKKSGYWNAAFLDSFTRQKNTSIAIIYDSWIDRSIPGGWKKVAEWKIRDNVVCGDDYVSFYAIEPGDAAVLRKNLEAFQPSLPATVGVTYY